MKTYEELDQEYNDNIAKIKLAIADNVRVVREKLQVIHGFKIGDIVEYNRADKVIKGRIDIIDGTSFYGNSEVVIYPYNKNGQLSKKYISAYLSSYSDKASTNLKVIGE